MLKIKPPNYVFCPFCGRKIGTITLEGKSYQHCAKDKWTFFPCVDQSANAVIIKNGKILLSRRRREPFKGKWMFPAGFVEYGEHPKETVEREIKEETGLAAENPVFLAVFQTEDDPRSMGNLAFFYKVDVRGKVKNADNNENMDIKWFSLDALPEIAWKSHREVLKTLKDKRK